jgi:hypothetical protein
MYLLAAAFLLLVERWLASCAPIQDRVAEGKGAVQSLLRPFNCY